MVVAGKRKRNGRNGCLVEMSYGKFMMNGFDLMDDK